MGRRKRDFFGFIAPKLAARWDKGETELLCIIRDDEKRNQNVVALVDHNKGVI